MESEGKKKKKTLGWLSAKLRNHRSNGKAVNRSLEGSSEPRQSSKIGITESAGVEHQISHENLQSKTTNPTGEHQIDLEHEGSQRTRTEVLVLADVPVKPMNEIQEAHVFVAQSSNAGASSNIRTISEAKPQHSFNSLFKKEKPPEVPQIPSTPAADQAAYQFLLSSGFSLASKRKGIDLERALLWAIENRNANAVRLLLNKGAVIENCDTLHGGILHKAISASDQEVLRLLLHRQVDLETKNGNGWTALLVVAAGGNKDLMDLILDAGANLDARTPDGRNALDLALDSKYPYSIETLVRRGLDVNTKRPDGWTALHSATRIGNPPLVKFLLERGADIDAASRSGKTALHIAARNGYPALVNLLLERGASVTASLTSGEKAMDLAISNGSEDIIKVFLQYGAQPELCIYGGGELIKQTIEKEGLANITRLILAQHASDASSSRETVLHVAAKRGDSAVICLLLDNSFNVAAVDDLGRTALHLATSHGHETIVQLLLSKQADVLARCNSQSTPLHCAAEKGHPQIVKALFTSLDQNKAPSDSINVRDSKGRTSMYLAVTNGHADAVRLFIERRADHMIRDYYNVSAPTRAEWNGHRKVLEMLRSYENVLKRERRTSTSTSKGKAKRLGVRDGVGSGNNWSRYEAETGMVDPKIIKWV